MRSQLTLMESQFAVFREAPVYLKETLLFPYGYGAAFLQKVRANGQPWSAVDKIYSDLARIDRADHAPGEVPRFAGQAEAVSSRRR